MHFLIQFSYCVSSQILQARQTDRLGNLPTEKYQDMNFYRYWNVVAVLALKWRGLLLPGLTAINSLPIKATTSMGGEAQERLRNSVHTASRFNILF